MDLRLDDLRTFQAVAIFGSFSRAASTLALTPSAVTRSVDRLERGVGVQLFHRSTRSVVLSPAGELFVPHAARMLSEADAARQALRPGAVFGTLHLTCSATFSRLYLAPILTALADRHLELRFRLHLTDEQVDLIQGGFDAAIRIGPQRDSELKRLRIAAERRVLCASPGYLRRFGEPNHPKELERHRCISLGEEDDSWSFRGLRTLRVPCPVEADFGDFGLHAALSGLGIARLSHWLAAPSLRSGGLIRVLQAFEPSSYGSVSVLHTHHTNPPPRLKVFLEEVKTQLVPPPWEDDS